MAVRAVRARPRATAVLAAACAMAAVAAASSAAAPPAAAGQPRPAVRPAEQQFYWEWSDGVEGKSRTFTKASYKNPGRLPQLVVTAEPAKPQQYVKLQFKQHGNWMREDGAATNRAGLAYLTLNPICKDGKWCQGTYKYRAIIDGRYTVFTITYSLG